MSNIQRIIGVDPGLNTTGFGIIDEKKRSNQFNRIWDYKTTK